MNPRKAERRRKKRKQFFVAGFFILTNGATIATALDGITQKEIARLATIQDLKIKAALMKCGDIVGTSERGELIPTQNSIVLFFHCNLCMKIKPADKSPQEWGSLEVGFTEIGMQIWCKRHNVNVVHIDFQGHKHPYNDNR